MVEYVPYNSTVHKEDIVSMYSAHILEVANHFKITYQKYILNKIRQYSNYLKILPSFNYFKYSFQFIIILSIE